MATTQQDSPAPHPAEVAELGVPTFFVSSYFLVPWLASRGQALSVFFSLTVLAFLQFFAMRSEVQLSARGIMGRASDARRFMAERNKRP